VGLKGAVGLRTLASLSGTAADQSVLIQAKSCWLKLPTGQWIHSDIVDCAPQTRGLRLQLAAIADRTQAELLRGAVVGIARSLFPEAQDDETYWADLMGCQVVNRSGQVLGQVQSMQSNGEHDWLVLEAGWIPFVEHYIDQVDTDQKIIQVDWNADWFQ
jgi:16S rRNA processing protein RimM